MSRIEVVRESEDRLSSRVWKFSVSTGWTAGADQVVLLLDYYAEQVRASTRHKMKLADGRPRQWSRMERRSYFSGIEAKDVPLPDDVREEAIASVKVVVIGASNE